MCCPLVRWRTNNCVARGHIPKRRDVPRNICLGPFPGVLAAGREHLCSSPRGTLPGVPFHRLKSKSLGSTPAPVLPPLACPAFLGVMDGSRVKKAQTIRGQERRTLLPDGHWQDPQGALPTSWRPWRKKKQPGPWGLRAGGRFVI